MKTYRFLQMTLGWGTVGLVYAGSAWLSAMPGRHVVLLNAGWLDERLPFEPVAVWVYLSFFVLLPWAYAVAPLHRIACLRRAMQLSALVCGMIFVLAPTALPPSWATGALASDSVSAWMLSGLLTVDTVYNCLPSLHGALTVLAVGAVAWGARPWAAWLAVSWGAAIMFSVLLIRQHTVLDLAAGVAVGVACGVLARQTHVRRAWAEGRP